MSNTNQDGLTSEQRSELRKQKSRYFRRFWPIYVLLCFTAGLSFAAGLALPFMRKDVIVPLTWGTAIVALYYAVGFLTNGELLANFWFGKIFDQDPDNTAQKIIAWVMLGVSIVIVGATCISAADMVAFWMGNFDAFYEIPVWVQKYVVYVIPVMWVANAVAVMLFRSVSDEAISEREEEARKNKAMSNARIIEAQAYANEIIANAPALARQKGAMKAKAEIDLMQAEINEHTKKLLPSPQVVGQPEIFSGLSRELIEEILRAAQVGEGSRNSSDPTQAARLNGK